MVRVGVDVVFLVSAAVSFLNGHGRDHRKASPSKDRMVVEGLFRALQQTNALSVWVIMLVGIRWVMLRDHAPSLVFPLAVRPERRDHFRALRHGLDLVADHFSERGGGVAGPRRGADIGHGSARPRVVWMMRWWP